MTEGVGQSINVYIPAGFIDSSDPSANGRVLAFISAISVEDSYPVHIVEGTSIGMGSADPSGQTPNPDNYWAIDLRDNLGHVATLILQGSGDEEHYVLGRGGVVIARTGDITNFDSFLGNGATCVGISTTFDCLTTFFSNALRLPHWNYGHVGLYSVYTGDVPFGPDLSPKWVVDNSAQPLFSQSPDRDGNVQGQHVGLSLQIIDVGAGAEGHDVTIITADISKLWSPVIQGGSGITWGPSPVLNLPGQIRFQQGHRYRVQMLLNASDGHGTPIIYTASQEHFPPGHDLPGFMTNGVSGISSEHGFLETNYAMITLSIPTVNFAPGPVVDPTIEFVSGVFDKYGMTGPGLYVFNDPPIESDIIDPPYGLIHLGDIDMFDSLGAAFLGSGGLATLIGDAEVVLRQQGTPEYTVGNLNYRAVLGATVASGAAENQGTLAGQQKSGRVTFERTGS